MKISVHGFGKVGAPLCALLLDSGHEVYVFDPVLKTGEQVELPDLHWESDLYKESRDRNNRERPHMLRHGHDAPSDCQFDASLVIVPTPSLPGGGFDHRHVINAVHEAQSGRGTRLPIVMSTVSPAFPWENFPGVAYCPVMIALGNVYEGLAAPKLVLVGCETTMHAETVGNFMQTWQPWMPDARYFADKRRVVAWAKLLVNCYLSYKISFFNEMWLSLTRDGMPDDEARRALYAVASDPRIGEWGTTPGNIPAGPCLPRDVNLLRSLGSPGVESLCQGVAETSHFVVQRWAQELEDGPRPWGVCGITYKPGVPCEVSLGARVLEEMGGRAEPVEPDRADDWPGTLLDCRGTVPAIRSSVQPDGR